MPTSSGVKLPMVLYGDAMRYFVRVVLLFLDEVRGERTFHEATDSTARAIQPFESPNLNTYKNLALSNQLVSRSESCLDIQSWGTSPFIFLSKDIPNESPVWGKYAWKMRATRLDSLKLDPESFMSKYDSEAKQPIDFTIGRLRERNAWTFFLVRSPEEAASRNSDVLLQEDTEYVGFCVMIDLQSIPASMIEREGISYTDRGAGWFMAAVYVDRSVRGSGAGKRMVQFGLDTIRAFSRKTGRPNAVCITAVRHGNNNALELYKKLGFEVTNEDDVEEKEGKSYHMTELKMQL